MADEGYWKAKAHRAPKPPLAVGLLALVAVATGGLGVVLAEWLPPLFADLPEALIQGQAVTGIVFAALFLGLLASIGGWAMLEGLSSAQKKARPEPFVFVFLAPAGVMGALTCAFLMPGPLDDKLTEARITESWSHYVATVQFDESHLRQQYAQLSLGQILDPNRMGERNHWEGARLQLKLGHELVAKYRGYELQRRDEALKTVDEGNLRPEARARARQRILDGYAVLGPLFASRWDIVDAQMVLIEKGMNVMLASPGGWRAQGGQVLFTNQGQYQAMTRLIDRSRDLEDQEHAVACKLDKALSIRSAECEAEIIVGEAQRVR